MFLKTYEVTGTYNGKCTAIVKAYSLLEALKKLAEAEEDALEIEDPSRFQYNEKDVKHVRSDGL